MNKIIEQFSDKDHSQNENLDQYLDMDIRAGVSAETNKITENPFLSRGVTEKPNIEDLINVEIKEDYESLYLNIKQEKEALDIVLSKMLRQVTEYRIKYGKLDIKIIYGVEGYLFDDTDQAVAENDGVIEYKSKNTNHVIILAKLKKA